MSELHSSFMTIPWKMEGNRRPCSAFSWLMRTIELWLLANWPGLSYFKPKARQSLLFWGNGCSLMTPEIGLLATTTPPKRCQETLYLGTSQDFFWQQSRPDAMILGVHLQSFIPSGYFTCLKLPPHHQPLLLQHPSQSRRNQNGGKSRLKTR